MSSENNQEVAEQTEVQTDDSTLAQDEVSTPLSVQELMAQVSELEQSIQSLEQLSQRQIETVKEAEEKLLRSLAEQENFKKRKEQEKLEFMKYANEKFVKELLPVLDSFNMAIQQADSEEVSDVSNLKQGVKLIHKQFVDMLSKLGVTRLDALNQPFDPNLHQAISREQREDIDENIVIKEMQAGYFLNERVIRPAMVVVSHR